MSKKSKVFVRRENVWLAWYPMRGRRCQVEFDRAERFFVIALGPAYLCLGPGVPQP